MVYRWDDWDHIIVKRVLELSKERLCQTLFQIYIFTNKF